jgi:carbonic anhydrase
MDSYKKLLLSNKAWVKEKLEIRPDFFSRMANEQNPEFMWIGCSDSRVPAEDITGTEPGEIFVHRNIANLVVHTDFNLLSVLQFAVEVLEVKHIIVCGHYGCGGVKHALSSKHLGLINKWLRHIKDVYRIHERELDSLKNEEDKLNRFVELNVIEQVQNLVETSIVQRSWARKKMPFVHGWVYDIKNGNINDLCLMTSDSHVDKIYKFDFTEDQIKHYSEEV